MALLQRSGTGEQKPWNAAERGIPPAAWEAASLSQLSASRDDKDKAELPPVLWMLMQKGRTLHTINIGGWYGAGQNS